MSALQRMLGSTFPKSYLCIRGDMRDDPDLNPLLPLDWTILETQRPTEPSTSYRSSYSPESVSFRSPSPGQITHDLPERARRRLSTASSKREDRDPHNVAGTTEDFTLLGSIVSKFMMKY